MSSKYFSEIKMIRKRKLLEQTKAIELWTEWITEKTRLELY